ncbi:MAG: metallopeptidase family protein [Chloroflexi bacterium]|nr:metallopeptidase family protein [Chloroflexota bacterium]
MLRGTFEKLVSEALDTLPEEFRDKLANVEIVIEDWPSRQALKGRGTTGLLGLYEGIPLSRRSSGYTMVLPDKITIFQGPIESHSHFHEEIKKLVQRVVIHEIAHHFGIDDARLRELGWG